MPTRYLLPLTAVFTAAFLGIAWILINFTDSNVPWLDSFTTALSIVGMWMLARKYVEQWWAWIAVDAVSSGLYIYKGLDFTAGLYALYTIIAIFGYFKWRKMMSKDEGLEIRIKKDMKDELSTSNEQLSTIDAVVLANGEYPAGPLPLKILAEAPYVVCCDGGANEYIRRGHTPDVIIGDGDSSVMKTAGSSDISYTVSATRRPTTRLKPSISCWRKANAASPSSVPRASVKTIHWEISACSSTISVPEPMYVPIPITASSSPAGVPAPSQAIPDSKYPSSTSLHTVCMAKDWSIPQRFHQLVARHTQRMHQYRIHHRGGRGIPGIRHYFFASATSTKYTLIQIMAMAAACVQLKRSCPKVKQR